jgi:hypothetical protein
MAVPATDAWTVVTFNVADLPWLFEKRELRALPDRLEKIRTGLAAYDYALLQEDWMQKLAGVCCGHWYWFPSGLTLRAPATHPFTGVACTRHRRAGARSGDLLARKGWQLGTSRGVVFANTHLDAHELDRPYREEQARDLCAGLPASGPLVLAGDLNTYGDESQWMDACFRPVGLIRVTAGLAAAEKDHIYARGLQTLAVGVDPALTRLSDHPAVWARFRV